MLILDLIDRLNGLIGRFVSYAIWIGMAIVVYEVVMRYVFSSPSVWVQGYTQRVFGSYFILIGAFTLIQRGHVRVDLLLTERSPRRLALMDMLNYALLLVWMLALSLEAWLFFQDAWRFNERDESALGHPLWPVKLALMIGVVLMALQGLAEFIRAFLRLIWPHNSARRS